MTLTLDDKWIWDFWLARDGEDWHVFFLQADKSLGDPELRHRNVTQGHAISRDLVNWQHQGTSFAPSVGPAWDDYTTWTGCVVQGDDGLWHHFYTGTSRGDGGHYQRIGHATSKDLHNWERVGDGLCLDISGPDYEEYTPGLWHERAFRDPWVIRNPDGAGWLMFMVSRVPGHSDPNSGGSVGLATSEDLATWTLRPPVYRGGTFGHMEVPQVFKYRDRWYCAFCTVASLWSEKYRQANPQRPVTGTHYLVADHPLGPWEVAPGPFLDGSEPGHRYANKIIDTEQGLMTMGFVCQTVDADFAGIVSDPIPVSVDDAGLLSIGNVPSAGVAHHAKAAQVHSDADG